LVKFLSSEEYQRQNVRAGLWLPNRTSLYTKEGIQKWLTKGVHPEGFETLTPYVLRSKVYSYAMLPTQRLQEEPTTQLDACIYGGLDLDTPLKNIETAVNQIMADL